MKAAISVCLSISSTKAFISLIYVVHKLCFSLITFNFFMWLGKCKYICMQVWIYVVIFVLPTSYNALHRYTNDVTIQLHEKDPDIVAQKVSLLGHMVNLGAVCLKIIPHYVSSSAVRIFSMIVNEKQRKLILILVIFF